MKTEAQQAALDRLAKLRRNPKWRAKLARSIKRGLAKRRAAINGSAEPQPDRKRPVVYVQCSKCEAVLGVALKPCNILCKGCVADSLGTLLMPKDA